MLCDVLNNNTINYQITITKMKNQLFAAALTALSLAACNKKDADRPQTIVDPVAMCSFTADIRTTVTSRASTEGTAFTAGDQVGIVPVKSSGVDEAQNNIPYTNNGTRFEAEPPYWFRDRGDVTFNAYYPYMKEMSDNTIPIDTKAENQTSDANGWRINDLLFASATTNVVTPTVSYTGVHAFRHQMSKLTLTFKVGDGIDDISGLQSYTIGNLVMHGSFNAATGSLALNQEAAPTTVTMTVPQCNGSEYTANSLILLPQAITGGALNLSILFSGQIYNARLLLSDGFQPGWHYTFTVTVSSTALTPGDAQIVNWETADGGTADATMPDVI